MLQPSALFVVLAAEDLNTMIFLKYPYVAAEAGNWPGKIAIVHTGTNMMS